MICWIFDLDGVITDLQEKKITNPKILEYMTQFLQNGEPIALNTGRSLDFIRQEVLNPLLSYLRQQHLSENLLHNFFAVGEKGNTWIEDEKDCFDTATSVPEDFSKKMIHLVEEKFPDSMFFDTTKKTMISLEMTTGFSLDVFRHVQEKLIPIIQSHLDSDNLSNKFHIDPSISATDIEHITAGKGKGIGRIHSWLIKRSISPQKYVVFGDSVADLGMGEKLCDLGLPFTFVFVGDPAKVQKQLPFSIVYTNKHFDKGVVEYLENLP